MAEILQLHGYTIVSGGTNNHLMLVDLRNKRITGREAEKKLEKAGITVNMNLIPFDPEKATVTSGIRIGLAGVTSRGFREEETEAVAQLIIKILENSQPQKIQEFREEVETLCVAHPVYMSRTELAIKRNN